MVTITRIREAAALLEGKIIRTPLVYSPTFSAFTGAQIYLKLEGMQKAGSFKVRGATNRILSKRSEIGKKGVIAASAGNHAQGVAVAGHIAGIPVTIVMPEWVSQTKQEAAAGYGAQIILKGTTLTESIDYARILAESEDMVFIHPYDDDDVITGQGTVGLEIAEDLPGLDTVLVPVGGGGLIAGIAIVIKELCPHARIIGIQTMSCPSAPAALREGMPVTIESGPTIADGIRVTRTGDLTFPFVRDLVDEIVTVDEKDIVDAILWLLERKKVIAEGAGATPLAALLSGAVITRPGEKVVAVISGGNIDTFLLERILRKGLFNAGRIMQCRVEFEDRPGSLPRLLSFIAGENGTITRIEQERTTPDLPLNRIRVMLELELRGHEHRDRILNLLRNAGYSVSL
jgi:threonine dehydratase